MPHAAPNAILFDDGRGTLAPLTDLRAAFDVRTGSLTTLERLRARTGHSPASLFVPARLADITRERHPGLPINRIEGAPGSVLLLSARCPLPPAAADTLPLNTRLTDEAGEVIALHAPAADAFAWLEAGCDPSRAPGAAAEPLAGLRLLSRPWHVRSLRDACLAADLAVLCTRPLREPPPGVLAIGDGNLTVHPTAVVYPGVTIDLEHGPVFIGPHAVVRPGAILIGPCAIGEHATVLERATIRQNTAVGPWCKVNGEIGGVLFQGYSNKAHDGYLGDSFVGEWVNLGAGTTNSNLLNTYGEVITRATPDGKHERTGETFLGAIIGDHVKTAICTRIMTGSVLHTGGMFATTAAVSGCVAPFTWATDAGQRPYRFEKFIEVARAAMSRRKITPSEAYTTLLRDLCPATA